MGWQDSEGVGRSRQVSRSSAHGAHSGSVLVMLLAILICILFHYILFYFIDEAETVLNNVKIKILLKTFQRICLWLLLEVMTRSREEREVRRQKKAEDWRV